MSGSKRLSFLSAPSRDAGSKPQRAAPAVGCIDYVIQTLGCIVLVGWLATNVTSASIALAVPGKNSANKKIPFARYRRDDVNAALLNDGRTALAHPGFVCVFPLDEELANAIDDTRALGQKIGVKIELPSANVVQTRVSPISLREALDVLALGDAISALVAAQATDEDGRRFKLILGGLFEKSHLHCYLEAAHTADAKIALISGWCQGADAGELLLCDGALALSPTRLDAIIVPRDDVASHLSNIGASSGTNRLGFTAAAPIRARHQRVRLCSVSEGIAHWSGEFELNPRPAPLHAMVATSYAAARASNRNVAVDHERVASRLVDLASAPPPKISHLRVFEPATSQIHKKPLVSIILPFYGDSFYLLDHLASQRRLPSNVEWIIVCDDPRLADAMTQQIVQSQSLIAQTSTLIILANNGGFAHANNVAATYARGDFLLLMNSDVYCRDFSFMEYAVALLDAQADVGAVGFSLQFEDRTIQHDGVRFRRMPWFDGLWSCEHPGRGMPHSWGNAVHHEVPAVTAALMMLRRKDFPVAIFDTGFFIGDFEDADLCLQLATISKKTMLVQTDGLFHLGRQSVRLIGDEASLRGVALLNCIRFNKRWSNVLEQMEQAGAI